LRSSRWHPPHGPALVGADPRGESAAAELASELRAGSIGMAIYHLSVKPISRAGGRSATAAIAYRSGERVHDLSTGETFDYTRKRGVEHSEIVLPDSAAKRDINWARDRQALWNAAEAAEKRKDARVAREYELALPHEMTRGQRVDLVRGFAGELANRYGVAVDFAIHRPHRSGDERNFHAHVLATTREVGPTGLGAKASIEWSDTDRAKKGLGPAKGEVKAIRARWEDFANERLKELGIEARIDHRSLADQGVDREPGRHLGPAVSGMERRGIATEVGKRIGWEMQAAASERLARAAELGRVEREAAELQKSILDLSGDIKAAERERDAGRELTSERVSVPVDLEQLKARGRQASEQWRQELHRQQAAQKQAALEQRERERVVEEFKELAMDRAVQQRLGYQDRSKVWQATPQRLRESIERFNAQPQAVQAGILERMTREPAIVRDLQQDLAQRRAQVKQLDRDHGLEL
jgi:hypothetical protein